MTQHRKLKNTLLLWFIYRPSVLELEKTTILWQLQTLIWYSLLLLYIVYSKCAIPTNTFWIKKVITFTERRFDFNMFFVIMIYGFANEFLVSIILIHRHLIQGICLYSRHVPFVPRILFFSVGTVKIKSFEFSINSQRERKYLTCRRRKF